MREVELSTLRVPMGRQATYLVKETTSVSNIILPSCVDTTIVLIIVTLDVAHAYEVVCCSVGI